MVDSLYHLPQLLAATLFPGSKPLHHPMHADDCVSGPPDDCAPLATGIGHNPIASVVVLLTVLHLRAATGADGK